MIEGDKVLCIKEHTHYKFTHNLGEIYYVDIFDHSDNSVYISTGVSDSVLITGLWISLNPFPESPPFEKDVPYVYDYFIVLAKWREQQINSILDEN